MRFVARIRGMQRGTAVKGELRSNIEQESDAKESERERESKQGRMLCILLLAKVLAQRCLLITFECNFREKLYDVLFIAHFLLSRSVSIFRVNSPSFEPNNFANAPVHAHYE